MTKDDWDILTDGKLSERQSGKDAMILKLYIALMGKKFEYSSPTFIIQASQLFVSNRSQIGIFI